MQLSHLRAFLAASRTHNIARAAESLHLTPSPVSRTLRQLEQELGVQLFERRYHELAPTDAGRDLLPRVVEILSLVDDLVVPADRPRAIRVGCTPWAPARYIERVREAMHQHDEPLSTVTEAMSSTLLVPLAHGDLDLAVVHLPVDLPGVSVRPLARYQFYAFSSADSGLPETTIHLSELAGRRGLTLPSALQPAPMEELVASARNAGLDMHEIDFAQLVMLESLLRGEQAVLLCNAPPDTPLWPMLSRGNLIRTPLDLDDIHFELGLVWRTADSLRGDRIRALVEHVHPSDKPAEVV
ncbi:LysR family transcriptional regulator [Microbacterium sp. No. 7]|uniref:LysR family transcriptional regulator n=1 Tax=Microbacterium sp. No. 7 TaxID=1714373 RepID=UPI0006D01916|nr:LysR family transcriptional regulator [Microbacterium sp. No. 7]ALJ19947.1 hypothetical protein AOA12_08515 [Microbacterium sp. No. 7]